MARKMSFRLTADQIRAKTKTVTRRAGTWNLLKPGDVLDAVVKSQGLKKGEKVEKLATIRVVSARHERLVAITREDVAKEGFPQMSTLEFIDMFSRATGCQPNEWVVRIEFEYL